MRIVNLIENTPGADGCEALHVNSGSVPKNLSVYAIFGFSRALRKLRRGSRDLLCLGEVSAEAKAVN